MSIGRPVICFLMKQMTFFILCSTNEFHRSIIRSAYISDASAKWKASAGIGEYLSTDRLLMAVIMQISSQTGEKWVEQVFEGRDHADSILCLQLQPQENLGRFVIRAPNEPAVSLFHTSALKVMHCFL